jgi:hypothetical protein
MAIGWYQLEDGVVGIGFLEPTWLESATVDTHTPLQSGWWHPFSHAMEVLPMTWSCLSDDWKKVVGTVNFRKGHELNWLALEKVDASQFRKDHHHMVPEKVDASQFRKDPSLYGTGKG